jgi:hypothetical protein
MTSDCHCILPTHPLPVLPRIIHDGSSSPTHPSPIFMGEGEGGGAFLVKRIYLKIVVSAEL